MKSPAHDLVVYLAAQSIGTWPGSLSVNVEPTEPANVVTVYDTGGEGPDTNELDLMRPTFQVRVRSVDPEAGYLLQERIRDLLMLPGRIVTADSAFVVITPTSDIASLGRDDNDRYLTTLNYNAIRERS
jgi:Bacteriophage minor capsid protein